MAEAQIQQRETARRILWDWKGAELLPMPLLDELVDRISAALSRVSASVAPGVANLEAWTSIDVWLRDNPNATATECLAELVKRIKIEPAPASTVAPQESDWLLDCPVCNAPKSFAIDSSDDAVGFCLAERRNWRIIDTTCSADGCFQPKATFGDLCMGCLAKAVDSQ